MAPIPKPSPILIGGAAVWIAAVIWGFWKLLEYETTPGEAALAPRIWPEKSSLARATDRPTLLMFVHPHCPCSRASLEELDRLLAQSRERVSSTVLFVKAAAAAEGWEKTDSWRTAGAIPGVSVKLDVSGSEAALFQARTSGTVVLYGADGKLLFSGGITQSRGHSGDNAGRSAIVSLLTEGHAKSTKTPAFGCALFSDEGIEHGQQCKKQ